MSDESRSPAESKHPGVAAGILARAGSIAVVLIIEMAILFLAAGRLSWTWAWVYLGISLASMAVVAPITLRASPEMVAERGLPRETLPRDKILAALWLLLLYVVLPLVAGLDARLAWTRGLAVAWNLAGAALLAAGLALTGWAMIVNAYFSTAIRIQEDRGHAVCRSGPYRYVRHPGYVGYILQAVGTALVLGSLWALIPAAGVVAVIAIRTAIEDRFLLAGLPGYREYAQQARCRLLPGIW